jgi:hypothetical protein
METRQQSVTVFAAGAAAAANHPSGCLTVSHRHQKIAE